MWNILFAIVAVIFIMVKTGLTLFQLILFFVGIVLILFWIFEFSKRFFTNDENALHNPVNQENNDKNKLKEGINYIDYFLNHNLKIIIRSDNNMNTNKVYKTLDEQITNSINHLIFIDNQPPPVLKKDIYETTKEFEDRVERVSLEYKKKIEWQITRRDTYLEILNKIKKDGNKKTLREKIFGRYNIYKIIFDTYAKTIKEYYSNPYLENIVYNADTKEIRAILKFISLDDYAQYILFANITPLQAKRIIENKNYTVVVIFETNFNEVYIADILFLINGEKNFQGKLVDKNTYQLKPLEIKIDKIESNIKPIKIEIKQNLFNESGSKDESVTDYNQKLKEIQSELENIKNEFKKFDKIDKGTNQSESLKIKELEEKFESRYEAQNKFIKSINSEIENLSNTIKSNEKGKLTEGLHGQLITLQKSEIQELQNKLITKEQNTKNLVDSLIFKVENTMVSSKEYKQIEELTMQAKVFQSTLTYQSEKIIELQNQLIKKEKNTKSLVDSFMSKINKLEEKIAKQKVVKTKIPLNIPTEKQSIKKDDGVIVKRESFDDF